MDIQHIWLNLPVSDVARSKKFFNDIGFKENPRHKDVSHLASFLIGKHDFVLMLFPNESFEMFTHHKVSNTSTGAEMLINIGAMNKEEVDEMAIRVKNAGGKVFAEPAESQGWMYAFGFEDPDGHRWSMLYMDMEKMPTN